MKCDLHIHSTKSDGAFSPAAIASAAKKAGLECISITDHDTASGVSEAMEHGAQIGLKVIPGIEISTYDDVEIHILLYNFDQNSHILADKLKFIAENRRIRNYLIVKKLSELGITVDLDAIYRQKDGKKTIGRPDIADDMIKQGLFANRHETFDAYLGMDKPAYVKSARVTPKEAIELGQALGGVSVLAHPKNLKLPQAALETLTARLKSYGLGGIEADYFSHTTSERIFYRSLADRYKLCCTGGSDFHDRQQYPLGDKCFIPGKKTRQFLQL